MKQEFSEIAQKKQAVKLNKKNRISNNKKYIYNTKILTIIIHRFVDGKKIFSFNF